MTISYVVLFVKNMERTLAVYRDAIGLEVERRCISCGKGRKAHGRSNPSGDCLPLRQSQGFEVKSLEETAGKMKRAGMKVVNEPYSPVPEVIIITMREPDGETIELMQNL